MLLTKMKEIKPVRRMTRKISDGSIYESVERGTIKKIQQFNQIRETTKQDLIHKLHTFQVVDGVSIWEVNRKLKKLLRMNIPKDAFHKQNHKILLSKKKSNTLATPSEIERIESTIDELEGFEELRLHYFHYLKPSYKEKKLFGEIERWIEISID
jgi:hypothetical protein